MSGFKFVWDVEKTAVNRKKHGISFEGAITAFYDENGREFYDPGHSQLEEERFLFLGISGKLRLLLICYCFRESDTMIRIISARRATKKETLFYKKGI